MQQTDNPLDLAIEGSGFFVLQDEEGKDFLTRNGSFSINKEGFIVARDGKKLQGENGSVRIDQEFFTESRSTGESKALDVKVAETGEIFVNDYEVGKLMLADAENPQSLQRISASNFVFTFDSEPKYLQGSEVRLRQGWLEGSNVNIVDEMIRMIDLQRQFEAGSKVIQTNEGTLQNSIQLGRYY
jgi:flagellar basal-body rod protein FlgG